MLSQTYQKKPNIQH